MISNRALAFIVCLPIAGMIGFAAGRATGGLGPVLESRSDGGASLRVVRKFSLGPPNLRVQVVANGSETEVLALQEDGVSADEAAWAADGSLAGVLINRSKLAVIDPKVPRVLYQLPLLEKMDGSRFARGVAFSSNGNAITFDDCPRFGAGCRSRLMALPVR